MTYIDPDVLADETATAEAILSAIADRIAGWEPADASPETEMAEAVAVIASTIATMLRDEERKDYAGFATRILNLPRGTPEVATAESRWTFTEQGSYFIPDGSEVVLDLPDGTPIAFATVGDLEVTDALQADGVPLVALEPGEQPNGLIGPGRDFEDLPFVSAVELTTAAAGGADEEPLEEYLAKVADRARRVKVVPITVDDYAAIALDHPSVERCLAVRLLDLNNPPDPGDPPSSGGHVTVFPVDAAGNGMSPPIKLEVAVLAQGEDRPLAVTVHVGDPEHTDLDVAVTIRLEPGAEEAVTVAAVQAAITSALDPATFALDETKPGRWRAPASTADRTLRHYDIAHIADSVAGVAGVTAASINGAAQVELTGWAPLPHLTEPPTVAVAP